MVSLAKEGKLIPASELKAGAFATENGLVCF